MILLFSGLGTLIFFVVVAGRVPSYLGSSFSFIAVVIAASGYSGHGPNPNLDRCLRQGARWRLSALSCLFAYPQSSSQPAG
ncbi:MAG TPA: solute carrier family 23 protein [Stellaceae bacterium]|nr:solute carrier family 23 protein [Stellaceae bacterium]